MPVLDLDLPEQTEIDEEILGILTDGFLDLLKNIVKNNLTGLLLHLRQFSNSPSVELDTREGQIDLILHLHAILDQKFLHDAENELLGVLLRRSLRGELHYIISQVRKSETRMMRSCSNCMRHHLEKAFHTFE